MMQGNMELIFIYLVKLTLLLESINLSPLSNVTSIGNYFVNECNKLESINLSGLSNVTSIGKGLLTPYVSFPVPS
jgi:hypothetical protein